jgi:hypothetical protein
MKRDSPCLLFEGVLGGLFIRAVNFVNKYRRATSYWRQRPGKEVRQSSVSCPSGCRLWTAHSCCFALSLRLLNVP